MKVDDLKIKLSFDDSSRRVTRDGEYTFANIRSYFDQEYFDKFFNGIGFENLPDAVRSSLKKYGYKFDYKLGGWATTTRAIIKLQDGDVDNKRTAYNIACTKAKKKAYERASKCLIDMGWKFMDSLRLLTNSIENIKYLAEEESEALERCIETGFCNPNYKKTNKK